MSDPISQANAAQMIHNYGASLNRQRRVQDIHDVIVQLRGYAHCNCPPDDDGEVRYHSNCARKMKPLIDRIEHEVNCLIEEVSK